VKLEGEVAEKSVISKKDRNRESAAKYRLKRKERLDTLEDRLKILQQRVADLGKENTALRSQITTARKLMLERNIPFVFEGC